MKSYPKLITFMVVALMGHLLYGCIGNGRLTRRYKSIEIRENQPIDQFISAGAYVIASEKGANPAPKTVFDLSPKAQAELIKAYAAKETKSDSLIVKLTAELSSQKAKEIKIVDYTIHEKKIVIPIQNKSHYPADRIAKMTVHLKLPENSGFTIISCNKLETQYQSYDLGKLTATATNQAELNASFGLENTLGSGGTSSNKTTDTVGDKRTATGLEETTSNIAERILTDNLTESSKVTKGLSGKLSATRSLTEEVLLKQRIIALNASISNDGKTLSIYQEGVSGIDLAGNVVITIILENKANVKVEKVHSFSNLTTGLTANTPDKIKITTRLFQYPNLPSDVTACMNFEGDFRKVTKRDKTISEADDRVELLTGTSTDKDIPLLRKNQFQPLLYAIYFQSGAVSLPIRINQQALVFSSFSEARDFTLWLQTQAGALSLVGNRVGASNDFISFPNSVQIDNASVQNLSVGFF